MRLGACHAVLSVSNEAEGYGIDGWFSPPILDLVVRSAVLPWCTACNGGWCLISIPHETLPYGRQMGHDKPIQRGSAVLSQRLEKTKDTCERKIGTLDREG